MLQWLAETEQPIPRTLEQLQVPGSDVPPPPPPPVLPVLPEHGHPQLQVTSDPADTTSPPEKGQKKSRAPNGPVLITDDSAVNPGNRNLSYVFTASSFG